MGHCIHLIIAPASTGDSISRQWQDLPRLCRDDGYSFFPICADLIDARIAPDKTPTETDDEFMLLTKGFRSQLRHFSLGGQLAYIETDYFGGVGGQGALVCRDGSEIMPPEWRNVGAINKALKLIGMKRGVLSDRFTAAGLTRLRHNDDVLDLIARQTGKQGPLA